MSKGIKERLSQIKRDETIGKLQKDYQIHNDLDHYLIASATIDKYAHEIFEAGWQAAMEYLHTLPVREVVGKICKESKGDKQ